MTKGKVVLVRFPKQFLSLMPLAVVFARASLAEPATLAPAKNVAAGDYEAHWNALSDRDAAKGFRVISAMMASPKETVHFIEQRL